MFKWHIAVLTVLSAPVLVCAAETRLKTVLVASGFRAPLFAGAPTGDTSRLFIVEKRTGRIKIINLADNSVNAAPFLDIGDLVVDEGGEQGLLGLAFHPDYANNGFFYVNYNDNSNDTVIARYRVSDADPDAADSGSAKIILHVPQPSTHHKGGMIAFGPNDGYFYVGMGDGHGGHDPGNRAQDGQVLLGKLLRIDVDVEPDPYLIPPSNPFVGDLATRDEIWARGLRNPWRWSFDRATGDMYIGDVGKFTREEIDFQPASSSGGENYGWRCMEGLTCTGVSGCICFDESLTLPIRDYGREVGRCVIGGYVYRGERIPDLRGTYFHMDGLVDTIWSFRLVDGNLTDFRDRTAELRPDGGGLSLVTSFGEDAAGEIYMVTRAGRVFRIVADGLALGDLNGDDWVDESDIEPFLLALLDRAQYRKRYPEIDPDVTGDINCDGQLDAFDIEPFIGLLFD